MYSKKCSTTERHKCLMKELKRINSTIKEKEFKKKSKISTFVELCNKKLNKE